MKPADLKQAKQDIDPKDNESIYKSNFKAPGMAINVKHKVHNTLYLRLTTKRLHCRTKKPAIRNGIASR